MRECPRDMELTEIYCHTIDRIHRREPGYPGWCPGQCEGGRSGLAPGCPSAHPVVDKIVKKKYYSVQVWSILSIFMHLFKENLSSINHNPSVCTSQRAEIDIRKGRHAGKQVKKKNPEEKLTVLKWWDMTISTKLLVHPVSCREGGQIHFIHTNTYIHMQCKFYHYTTALALNSLNLNYSTGAVLLSKNQRVRFDFGIFGMSLKTTPNN